MRKKLIIIALFVLVISVLYISNIDEKGNTKADGFSISYNNAVWESYDKISQDRVNNFFESYKNLDSIRSLEEPEFEKSVVVIFHYEGKISGEIEIDSSGIYRDMARNTYRTDTDFFEEAMDIFNYIQDKND